MRLVMGLVLWDRRGIGDGREVPWSLALGTPRTRPCPLVYLASLGGPPLAWMFQAALEGRVLSLHHSI